MGSTHGRRCCSSSIISYVTSATRWKSAATLPTCDIERAFSYVVHTGPCDTKLEAWEMLNFCGCRLHFSECRVHTAVSASIITKGLIVLVVSDLVRLYETSCNDYRDVNKKAVWFLFISVQATEQIVRAKYSDSSNCRILLCMSKCPPVLSPVKSVGDKQNMTAILATVSRPVFQVWAV